MHKEIDLKIKAKKKNLILLPSTDFVVCLISRVLCMLRNPLEVVNDVSYFAGFSTQLYCTSFLQKQVIWLGKGRSFVPQKGPGAHLKC